MTTKPAAAVLCALALSIAGCDEGTAPEAGTAGEPLAASPTAAPGVPLDELATREAVEPIGIAARSLVDADDMESARDALGTVEQALADGTEELPEEIARQFEAALEMGRDAVASDDLLAARAAGQQMINAALLSETLQDPTLIRPEGDQPVPTPVN